MRPNRNRRLRRLLRAGRIDRSLSALGQAGCGRDDVPRRAGHLSGLRNSASRSEGELQNRRHNPLDCRRARILLRSPARQSAALGRTGEEREGRDALPEDAGSGPGSTMNCGYPLFQGNRNWRIHVSVLLAESNSENRRGFEGRVDRRHSGRLPSEAKGEGMSRLTESHVEDAALEWLAGPILQFHR